MNIELLRNLYKDQYTNKIALAPTLAMGGIGAMGGAMNGLIGKTVGDAIEGHNINRRELGRHVGTSALAHALAGIIFRHSVLGGAIAGLGANLYSLAPMGTAIYNKINK